MPVNPKQITLVQHTIFSWWTSHRRDLPWRYTRDPYKILVSEIMLQQTQVSRVLIKYSEFLLSFPTIYDLAVSSPAEIIRAWKGLGYNRRALYLRETAIAVVQRYSGTFPQTVKELKSLPGIGPYTAGAIMVFAYEKDEIMIDTNIRKIITHFFYNDVPQPERIVEETARQIVPKGKSWDWHQALMDYGALELERTAKKVPRSTSKPFKQTDRFYRGRIIDALRLKKTSQQEITQTLVLHGKSSDEIRTIIERLIYDGLVVREAENLSLPE